MTIRFGHILATVFGVATLAAPLPSLSLPTDRATTGEPYAEALSCLALNVYWEARSEPLAGQNAVAAVTLNRVEDAGFPDTVCGVVKQGGERRHRCQFSWWCDGKSDEPENVAAWQTALAVARNALDDRVGDPTAGALYYHATYVSPRWAGNFKRTTRIGRHLFYATAQAPETRPPAEPSPIHLAALYDVR